MEGKGESEKERRKGREGEKERRKEGGEGGREEGRTLLLEVICNIFFVFS